MTLSEAAWTDTAAIKPKKAITRITADRIRSYLEIGSSEWTRDDRLRQPVFLGIREDKSPSDVVREKAS
jgi:ATP-dependent DNA ligase